VSPGEGDDVVVIGAQVRNERPSPGLGPVASRVVEHVGGTVLAERNWFEGNFRNDLGSA
jgi:hypothetical protein